MCCAMPVVITVQIGLQASLCANHASHPISYPIVRFLVHLTVVHGGEIACDNILNLAMQKYSAADTKR